MRIFMLIVRQLVPSGSNLISEHALPISITLWCPINLIDLLHCLTMSQCLGTLLIPFTQRHRQVQVNERRLEQMRVQKELVMFSTYVCGCAYIYIHMFTFMPISQIYRYIQHSLRRSTLTTTVCRVLRFEKSLRIAFETDKYACVCPLHTRTHTLAQLRRSNSRQEYT